MEQTSNKMLQLTKLQAAEITPAYCDLSIKKTKLIYLIKDHKFSKKKDKRK